ncbi:MAG TPA: ribosome maturation factor RimM [Cytophagaceae bacterium]|jgi:16S rRNA processing protein RimM|nr:ribosome maturation factor RimM [Cytophagaceae bacterium]
MNFDSCFKLGKINKAHGLKGDLKASLEAEFPIDFSKLESVFVNINNKLIPFFIDKVSLNGKKAIFSIEGIKDLNAAETLFDKEIFLPNSLLPEKDDTVFSYSELVGYTVSDKTLGLLGKITDVYKLPGQDVLAMDYKEKEILIPASEELITKLEKRKKIIHIEIPEGLLEIYL